MSFCLVLLAAGNSERFKSQIPKPFVKIGEKTLLDHSLIKLSQIKEIKKIILVLNKKHKRFSKKIKFKNLIRLYILMRLAKSFLELAHQY